MKYVMYLRKSTDSEDRQVHSLEDQRSVLTELAQKYGLDVVKVYEESKSAKAPGREQFNLMLNDIEAGEAQGILVWKLDRLARNFIDGGKIIHMLQNGIIQEIQSFEKKYLPIDNVMLMAVELGMANQYVRDLSVNVKRGNQEKLKRGGWPNKAPLGYINNKATKQLEIDPTHAPYVIKMFEMYSTGLYSFKDIQDELYSQGLRSKKGNKIFKATIHRLINMTLYYGVLTAKGKTYVGNHEPLISQELYEKCQNILGNNSRPRKKTKGFTLSGLMKCEKCGCAITAEIKKERHIYYHCTNGKGICDQRSFYTNEKELHKQLLAEFSDINIDMELLEIVYEAKLEEMQATGEYDTHALDTAQQELKNINLRRSRLVDTYIANQIDQELYDSKIAELDKEKSNLQNQIKILQEKTHEPVRTIELTKKAFIDASSLASRYFEAENSEKRVIAFEALSNCTLKEREMANFSYKTPYSRLIGLPKSYDFEFMLPD